MGVMLIIEVLLVSFVGLWFYDRFVYNTFDTYNAYMEHDQTYTEGELFMLGVIWHIRVD